jgi:hypothetical protein
MIQFTPLHQGLYHTDAAIAAARADRALPPLAAAWEHLKTTAAPGPQLVVRNATAARFTPDLTPDSAAADTAADEAAAIALQVLADLLAAPVGTLDVNTLMMCAHALELLRGGRTPVPAALIDGFTTHAAARTAGRAEALAEPRAYTDGLMLTALAMASAIVNEDAAAFSEAVGVVDTAVRGIVRPQGFIAPAVEGKTGQSMNRSVRGTAALVLMAEMAAHAGTDLWGLEVRGVSVRTAAIYPMYYFYTTQKWKWDEGITPEEVQSLYATYGGYLEMTYRRFPSRDIRTVLDELRPVFTPAAGGFATLTHAAAEKKRRGLFGF